MLSDDEDGIGEKPEESSKCIETNTTNNNIDNNFFKQLCNDIVNDGLSNMDNGSIRLAEDMVNLNKKTELWIDEAQDLENVTYIPFSELY